MKTNTDVTVFDGMVESSDELVKIGNILKEAPTEDNAKLYEDALLKYANKFKDLLDGLVKNIDKIKI